MKRSTTPSYILTLPLSHVEIWQRDVLDKIFRVCGNMSNNLIADRLKALKQLENTNAWKQNQAAIQKLCEERNSKLKDGNEKRNEKIAKEYNELLKPFYEIRNELLKRFDFTEFAFQSRIQKWRKHYKELVHTHVAQKLASQVWKKFEDYFFGKGREIKFIPWTEFTSIEGKANNTGIFYKKSLLSIYKLKLSVKFAKAPQEGKTPTPSYVYEQTAMQSRIKFCRLTRRWYPEGWRYFVQFVLEGEPPRKVNPETGELLYPIGDGRVGHDIGPQTLAVVGNKAADLVELAPGAQNIEKQLRVINRAMDRSKRALNPELFNEDGTIKRIDKLPPHCIDKRGRRIWKNSKRYQKLVSIRRFLYRRQTAIRVQQHHEFANRYLMYGDTHYIETMSFKGLAKRAKKTEVKPGEKQKCRKRFGKSIANKAPAAFVNILERKVLDNGGKFYRINTWKAKASQYNHLDHTYKPKKLAQRWNIMPDGRRIQRDLYSAFLLQHTNANLDGFVQDLCDKDYENFVMLHDNVIALLLGKNHPSSMGVKN